MRSSTSPRVAPWAPCPAQPRARTRRPPRELRCLLPPLATGGKAARLPLVKALTLPGHHARSPGSPRSAPRRVVFNERVRNPLQAASILRSGRRRADATQLVAIAGFLPISSSRSTCRLPLLADPDGCRLPTADGRLHHRGRNPSQLFTRTAPGRWVLGTVIAAAGSLAVEDPGRRPYLSDIPPGLLTVSIGMGGVFTA